jgi:hypothetical protein
MNTNLKRAIVGLALLFSMGMANAITYNITGPSTYTNPVFQPKSSTGFVDIYSFTILTPTEVIVSVKNRPASGHNNNFNIIGLCLTFQSISCPVGNSFDVNLGAGTYSFDITGTAIGAQGGKYLEKYRPNVSNLPIPEPATYAMMLAGLGLLGFTAYRRKSLDV